VHPSEGEIATTAFPIILILLAVEVGGLTGTLTALPQHKGSCVQVHHGLDWQPLHQGTSLTSTSPLAQGCLHGWNGQHNPLVALKHTTCSAREMASLLLTCARKCTDNKGQ